MSPPLGAHVLSFSRPSRQRPIPLTAFALDQRHRSLRSLKAATWPLVSTEIQLCPPWTVITEEIECERNPLAVWATTRGVGGTVILAFDTTVIVLHCNTVSELFWRLGSKGVLRSRRAHRLSCRWPGRGRIQCPFPLHHPHLRC